MANRAGHPISRNPARARLLPFSISLLLQSQNIERIKDGHVLTITYDKLLEIYFQNPQFGYYFLVLTSQRLLENIARLDTIVAQHKAATQQAPVGAVGA